jgi:serine O-acetyltransferase
MTEALGPRPPISATVPDWTRERPRRFWDPARRLLRALRGYQAAKARGGIMGKIAMRRWTLSHRVWSVITRADIPLNSRIGGGLAMPHPDGIVIHSRAEIGPNCLIMHQVTIGLNRGGTPRLGGRVDVGPGAKVLGPITVGEGASIGANAVVIRDVAPWSVVAGVPARQIGTRSPDAGGAAP